MSTNNNADSSKEERPCYYLIEDRDARDHAEEDAARALAAAAQRARAEEALISDSPAQRLIDKKREQLLARHARELKALDRIAALSLYSEEAIDAHIPILAAGRLRDIRRTTAKSRRLDWRRGYYHAKKAERIAAEDRELDRELEQRRAALELEQRRAAAAAAAAKNPST